MPSRLTARVAPWRPTRPTSPRRAAAVPRPRCRATSRSASGCSVRCTACWSPRTVCLGCRARCCGGSLPRRRRRGCAGSGVPSFAQRLRRMCMGSSRSRARTPPAAAVMAPAAAVMAWAACAACAASVAAAATQAAATLAAAAAARDGCVSPRSPPSWEPSWRRAPTRWRCCKRRSGVRLRSWGGRGPRRPSLSSVGARRPCAACAPTGECRSSGRRASCGASGRALRATPPGCAYTTPGRSTCGAKRCANWTLRWRPRAPTPATRSGGGSPRSARCSKRRRRANGARASHYRPMPMTRPRVGGRRRRSARGWWRRAARPSCVATASAFASSNSASKRRARRTTSTPPSPIAAPRRWPMGGAAHRRLRVSPPHAKPPPTPPEWAAHPPHAHRARA